jgi:hypothetical protein
MIPASALPKFAVRSAGRGGRGRAGAGWPRGVPRAGGRGPRGARARARAGEAFSRLRFPPAFGRLGEGPCRRKAGAAGLCGAPRERGQAGALGRACGAGARVGRAGRPGSRRRPALGVPGAGAGLGVAGDKGTRGQGLRPGRTSSGRTGARGRPLGAGAQGKKLEERRGCVGLRWGGSYSGPHPAAPTCDPESPSAKAEGLCAPSRAGAERSLETPAKLSGSFRLGPGARPWDPGSCEVGGVRFGGGFVPSPGPSLDFPKKRGARGGGKRERGGSGPAGQKCHAGSSPQVWGLASEC